MIAVFAAGLALQSPPAAPAPVVERPKPVYDVLTAPVDATPWRDRLGTATDAVWRDGDVLTFLRRSDAATVAVTGGIQLPLRRIGRSDLFILQVRMPRWDQAFFQYLFLEGDLPPARLEFRSWRGPQAPEAPTPVADLRGRVTTFTFRSEALGEDRTVNVYLPPNAPKSGLPAVFLADGVCESLARLLEADVVAGRVRPFAIVGIPSAGYRGDRSKPFDPNLDFRGKEYVESVDPDRFARHLTFFVDEVGAEVARRFGVSQRREDRVVGGFSNGGAFTASVVLRRPEAFGHAMPFSIGIMPGAPKPEQPMPRVYAVAGELETGFLAGTRATVERLRGFGAEVEFETFVAGHDAAMWDLAMVRHLRRVFAAPAS